MERCIKQTKYSTDSFTDKYFNTVSGLSSVRQGETLMTVMNLASDCKDITSFEHAVYFVYATLNETYCIIVKEIFIL